MLQEVTYSDDEFGSDYEAEYDDVTEDEQSSSLIDEEAADDLTHEVAAHVAAVLMEAELTSDHSATSSVDTASHINEAPIDGTPSDNLDAEKREELPVAGADTDENARPDAKANSAISVRYAETVVSEAERIPHVPSASLDESTGTSAAEEVDRPDEHNASSRQPPKLPGQLAKLASIRSFSVPVVPAASLVSPSLLVPSNLRSTSVPVVPSNEIMGIHRQNSGRFRIETVSGTNARHKSIVRLPSVEEMIGQGDVMEEESDEEEDSDGDSESDDASDTSSHYAGQSPRGRSSSFQKIMPPQISPVLRTKSQPFITRLPSVIEVTAEEMLCIENMRDGDSETKSTGDNDDEKSDFSDDEMRQEVAASDVDLVQCDSPSVVVQQTELTSSEPDTNALSAGVGRVMETMPLVETELQSTLPRVREPPGAAVASSEPCEQSEEPNDEYEDDYDDPCLPDPTEPPPMNERNAFDGKQELRDDDDFDEFKGADEAKYSDDEYEGEGDNYADFEDENRRETELLLRETQLLIQKQHENTPDRVLLLGSIKSESPDIPDQSEPPDPVQATYSVSAVAAEAKVVKEELPQPTTEPESTAATATNFEDQYGGDDEFTTAEDDEEDEFDQYANDPNEAEDDDDAREDLREPSSSALEQEAPNDAVPGQHALASEAAQSLMGTSDSQLTSSGDTDAQVGVGISQAEASQVVTSEPEGSSQPAATDSVSSTDNPDHGPVGLLQSAPAATESCPPVTASSDGPLQESGQAEESKAPVDHSSDSTRSLQETKKEPSAALNSSSTAAQEKPARVVATRPSRPAAAAASGSTNSTPRTSRSTLPPAAAEQRKIEIAESVLKRERPRELRLKTQRAGGQSSSSPALSNTSPSPRAAQSKADASKTWEVETGVAAPDATASQPIQVMEAEATSPPSSPGREERRSPEKIAPYTPRVYVEEYEPPPPKAPVFRQKRVAKTKAKDARRKLLPVKSPPNLRIDLPSMDKTKRNWLFLNMFRYGDDVSKYESFVPQLVSPGLPQSAGRLARPDSALQHTYASSQAQAITAYGRSLRSGRRLVQPQQDPRLRERERNWAPIKPHESAIPAYDSILDKFCTTVTSPVIQRQIYQTRHDDLSPQLAYVLEKRVEKQWKAGGAIEAFDGVASSSYKTDVVHSPSSVSNATSKRSL